MTAFVTILKVLSVSLTVWAEGFEPTGHAFVDKFLTIEAQMRAMPEHARPAFQAKVQERFGRDFTAVHRGFIEGLERKLGRMDMYMRNGQTGLGNIQVSQVANQLKFISSLEAAGQKLGMQNQGVQIQLVRGSTMPGWRLEIRSPGSSPAAPQVRGLTLQESTVRMLQNTGMLTQRSSWSLQRGEFRYELGRPRIPVRVPGAAVRPIDPLTPGNRGL